VAEIDPASIARWRKRPWEFVEETFTDPESGKPYVLLPAELEFMRHAFKLGDDGRLLYPLQCYAAPKKSGKSAFGGMMVLVTALLHGGRSPEVIVCANDFEQSVGRTFEAVRKIVECSPWLRRQARITSDRITFPSIGASILAIPSDYASAAGSNQNLATFDELWGFVSERARRLWDEMVPPPTRKIAYRLVTTHAGFEGESVLLEELYKRGMSLPEVAPSLRAGDGMLFAWHTEPVAPWQTEAWVEQMRRDLRPNQFLRMVRNQWVTTEASFVELSAWDACVDDELTPVVADRALPVWVGVDASIRRDATAIVAVAFDKPSRKVRLVNHRIFQPSARDPIDFEEMVEETLLDWHKRYRVRQVLADPYQMVGSLQRLARSGLPVEEYPQTVGRLTEMSQNLFELVKGRNLVVYRDEEVRLAVSRCVAVESARGWRIAKSLVSHKIDVVIALAMAALACVQGQGTSTYDSTLAWVDGVTSGQTESERNAEWRRRRFVAHVLSGGRFHM
jgi:phage terminase large subunit-like protein